MQIPSLHMQLNERRRGIERGGKVGGRKDKLHIIGRRGVEDFPLPSKNVGFQKGNANPADKTYNIIKL